MKRHLLWICQTELFIINHVNQSCCVLRDNTPLLTSKAEMKVLLQRNETEKWVLSLGVNKDKTKYIFAINSPESLTLENLVTA